MIDLVRHHASGKEIQETIIDPTVVQDFKEYTRLHRQSKGDPQALTGKFRENLLVLLSFCTKPIKRNKDDL